MNPPVIKARAWHTARKIMFSAEELANDQLTLMPDGSGFINVSSSDTRLSQLMPHIIPIPYTGLTCTDGTDIYCFDLVEAIVFGDRVTDLVHFSEGAWRLGGYEGTLMEHILLRVVGNHYQNPWPLNQDL